MKSPDSTCPYEGMGFEGGGECPVQYECTNEDYRYYVRYRGGSLSVARWPVAYPEREEYLVDLELGDNLDGHWNDGETTVYLGLIAGAIREDRVPALRLPTKVDVAQHEWYRPGPLPHHIAGLGCGIRTAASKAVGDQAKFMEYMLNAMRPGPHQHRAECYLHVPADQLDDWLRTHTSEHQLLVDEYPHLWTYVLTYRIRREDKPT
jgi:hypothetical protein